MKKRSRLALSSVFLLLAGCSTQTASEETINIWVIQPLSGPGATYGEDVMHGFNYMQEKINNEWWINGKKVNLIVEDGKCNGKDAVSAVQKLINVDKVEIVLGAWCSGETIPAARVAQKAWVLMATPISSSPEISHIGDYIFRYRNALGVTKVMNDYLRAKEAKSIAVVHELTDYAQDTVTALVEWFDGSISFTEKFASDERDFNIIAKKVIERQDEYDYLFFVPQTEAGAISFVKAMKAEWGQDIVKNKVLSSVTTLSQAFVDASDGMGLGIKGWLIADIDSFDEQTKQNLEEILGDYTPQSSFFRILCAADLLKMTAESIEAVWYSADAVRDHFMTFTEENKRDSLIGPFRFNQDGDAQWLPYAMFEIAEEWVVPLKA